MEAKDKFYDLFNKLRTTDNVKIFIEEMFECAGYIWGGRNSETGISARDAYRKYWTNVSLEMDNYIESFNKSEKDLKK